MPDDPTPPPSDPAPFSFTHRGEPIWTVESTLLHLSAAIASLERRILDRFVLGDRATALAMHAAETATDKSDAATAKHFEDVNGLHALILKNVADQVGRPEYRLGHDGLAEQIGLLRDRVERIESRGLGSKDTFAWVVAVVGIGFGIIGTISHFWK